MKCPKLSLKEQFDMLYVLIMSDGLGNSMFSKNEKYYLQEARKALTTKHGESDFRVKFLSDCILKSETSEFDVEDREWVRYILHAESEPGDAHEILLADLKERMEKK